MRRMNEKNHKPDRQSGQSLVEFAFSLVFILILLVGIVDSARALFTYMAMRDAAQEGALYATINPCATNLIINHIRDASDLVRGMNLTTDDIQVSIIGSACTGGGVRIQVEYPNFPLTMPFLGSFIGSQNIPIRVTVTDTIMTPKCPNSCP